MISDQGYIAPVSSPTGRVLADTLGCTVAELAGRGFHELGGSSLDAARATERLQRECGVRVPVRDLLAASDLPQLLGTVADAPLDPSTTPGTPPQAPAGDRNVVIPLTWQQRIVWYQSMLDPVSPRYHFHALFHFATTPDRARLRTALRRMLHRHPILRTTINLVGGEPVLSRPSATVADTDIHLSEVQTGSGFLTPEQLVALAGGDRPFDLRTGPLVRWVLVNPPDGTSTLVHTEHHLVHDGFSFGLLLETLADETDGTDRVDAADRDGPDVDDGYFRYAASTRSTDPAQMARTVRVCRDLGRPLLPAREMPSTDHDLFLRLPLPTRLVDAACRTASQQGTSLFTLLFTAFSVAVARLVDRTEFVLGTAIGNRPEGFERVLGMFVSTTPVAVGVADDEPSEQLLRRTAEALREAAERSDVPLPDAVAALGGEAHGVDRSPVGVAFSMHEHRVRRIRIAGAEARVELGAFNGAAKFPVNAIVLVDRSTSAIGCRLLVEGMRGHVSDDDLWQLWTSFVSWLENTTGCRPQTGPPLAGGVDVVAAVSARAGHDGSLTALEDDADRLSYRDLTDLGARVSGQLGDGARADVVGVYGGASSRFFAAAYAVMHAGAAYLPLDHTQPAARLAAMLAGARCRLVLDVTPDNGAARLTGADGHPAPTTITWAELHAPATARRVTDIATAPRPDDAAYVMFTSGSTGVPKGVEVSRGALAALCGWACTSLGLDEGVAVSQAANVGFDASCWEVWPALCAGARVRVVPDNLRADPSSLAGWFIKHGIEVAFAPTPVAELLMRTRWPDGSRVRVLGAGGDALHPVPADVPYRVINLYGPTECTVVSTAHWVAAGSDRTPPIGRVVPYGYTRVVNASGDELDGAAEGELWIGGEGVAKGYRGLPRATAARFVPDPYSPTGDRVYRTGDVVRRGDDGVLSFLGRQDRQVKISGARLDLGEVEAVALRQEGVRAAAAVIEDAPRRRLRLFVELAADADIDTVGRQVRGALPPYARHVSVLPVAALPLNRNGKVDLSMLAELSGVEARAAALARDYLHTEHLDGAWFQLGGSSLDAARLVSQLDAELGLAADLRSLLGADSVAGYLLGLGPRGASTALPARAPTTSAANPSAGVAAVAGPVEPSASVAVLWPALERIAVREKLELAERLVAAARAELNP